MNRGRGIAVYRQERGRMFKRILTVICDNCGASDLVPQGTLHAFFKIRHIGWKNTQSGGHICPACIKKKEIESKLIVHNPTGRSADERLQEM